MIICNYLALIIWTYFIIILIILTIWLFDFENYDDILIIIGIWLFEIIW